MTLKVWKSTDFDDEHDKLEWLKEKKREKQKDKFKKFDRKKRTLDFSIDTPEEGIKTDMQRTWERQTHPKG
jgi:hypothetical protein